MTALHVGRTDTDMSAGYEGNKVDPAGVVRVALAGVEAGETEVLADEWSAHVKKRLADHPSRLYDEIAAGIV